MVYLAIVFSNFLDRQIDNGIFNRPVMRVLK